MSGATPWFSTSHSPVGSVEGEVGAVTEAAVHQRRIAADPDQPAPRALADQLAHAGALKYQGMASPPEPANSLMIITFGPKIAPCGWRQSSPSRVATRLSSGLLQVAR